MQTVASLCVPTLMSFHYAAFHFSERNVTMVTAVRPHRSILLCRGELHNSVDNVALCAILVAVCEASLYLAVHLTGHMERSDSHRTDFREISFSGSFVKICRYITI